MTFPGPAADAESLPGLGLGQGRGMGGSTGREPFEPFAQLVFAFAQEGASGLADIDGPEGGGVEPLAFGIGEPDHAGGGIGLEVMVTMGAIDGGCQRGRNSRPAALCEAFEAKNWVFAVAEMAGGKFEVDGGIVGIGEVAMAAHDDGDELF